MSSEELISSFEMLVSDGERIVSSALSGPPAARQWRKRVIEWLKENVPDSGLSEDAILVYPPVEPLNRYSGRGLKASDQKGMQKLLKMLFRARDLIPTLRQNEHFRPTLENLRRVFIVHGKDEALKTSVARLLERLGLEPVILHEQPNRGRTIIEKFSDHADVSFAIVLLTADDRGGLSTDDPKAYQYRARQNVILELGYFVGRLGRKRVAAIWQEGVELPSDYQGVIFIPHDDRGAWRLDLAKELKDAGLDVDLNKI